MRWTVRSWAATLVTLLVAGAGWFYLAPTQIGGSTTYLTTHGISMEPMLHTGDLVLVRPASNYRVGQVVAYHSTLLHTLVLHRIVGRDGNHYVFKGDNNNFFDPTHPSRAQLVGTMWLRIPGGGEVLAWVKNPAIAALLTGGAAMLLLFGFKGKRRRRDQRRQHHQRPPRTTSEPAVVNALTRGGFSRRDQAILAACAAGVVLLFAISAIAFTRSTTDRLSVSHPYVQHVSFGYRALAPAGPVYPTGVVSTGEPVYAHLVHQLTVTAAYRLQSSVPHQVHGTIQMLGTLANTTGWTRTIALGAPTSFVGDRTHASATINVSRMESLISRIALMTGDGTGGSYTLAVVPKVKVRGEIAGERLVTSFGPPLTLTLGVPQLLSGTAATTSAGTTTTATGTTSTASSPTGMNRSVNDAVITTRVVAGTLGGIPVSTVRWLAPTLLALLAAIGLLMIRGADRQSPDPAEQINSRYKRLIVPVTGVTPDPNHPPIEVTSMAALAQLAERSERLILHDHRDNVDSYMIDDQGTIFRYSQLRVTDNRGQRNGHAGAMNGTAASAPPPAETEASPLPTPPAKTVATPQPVATPSVGDAQPEVATEAPVAATEAPVVATEAPEAAEVAAEAPTASPEADPKPSPTDRPDVTPSALHEDQPAQADRPVPRRPHIPIDKPVDAIFSNRPAAGPASARPPHGTQASPASHPTDAVPELSKQIGRAVVPFLVAAVVIRQLRARHLGGGGH